MLVCVLNIPPNFDEVMKVNARALAYLPSQLQEGVVPVEVVVHT
jgi:hypothetical protein